MIQTTRHNIFKAINFSSLAYLFILLLHLIFFPSLGQAQTIRGKVISVADGDTITILTSQKKQIKIRLYGIDTPEKAQAFGKQAKKFTASLVARKNVTVTVHDTDKYGRSVGVVNVGNINVNQELLRTGYAWQYRKYCKDSFCDDWLELEKRAQVSRVGLWSDKNAVAPWHSIGKTKGTVVVLNQAFRVVPVSTMEM